MIIKEIKQQRLEHKLIKLLEEKFIVFTNSVDWNIQEWYVEYAPMFSFSLNVRDQIFKINKKELRKIKFLDEFEDYLLFDTINKIYNINNYYSIIYI